MTIIAEEKLSEKQLVEINDFYQCCNEFDGTKYSFDENSDFQKENEINTFIFYENNRVVATLSIFAPTHNEAEVIAITSPEERGKGYLNEIIKYLNKELIKRGIKSILYVCDDKSEIGKAVITHIGAEYEFSEFLMSYDKNIEKQKVNNLIHIEKADEKDSETYIKINSEAFNTFRSDSKEIIKENFESENRTLYGIYYNNEIVGCIGVYEEDLRNYIFGFCIAPKFQKLGIGSYVLNEIVYLCSSNNNKEIVIEVQTKNNNALKVYKNIGFKIETEFRYYRKNI